MFTYLDLETHYAMQGSNITIEKLIEKAGKLGFSSLAITDPFHHGVIDFYKSCKKANIHPIIGLKANIEGIKEDSRNEVLLYALNNIGYKNLLKLASISAKNSYLKISEAKKLNDGVLAIYQTENSELLKYKELNMKNEFIEVINLLNTTFKDYFINHSSKEDLNMFFNDKKKLIYASKVRYLETEDKETSKILKKIFNINTEDLFDNDLDLSFKEVDEDKFEYKEALKNIEYIINNSNVDIDFDSRHLLSYPLKEKVSSKDYLKALVEKGFTKRFKGKKINVKTYRERLNYELKVIDDMGYNDYFLIVWDFVKYARSKDYLVGPGRGSAAASLVSYCLGITNVDSIEYELLFERFLNPERITMPDIDMDLPDDKRDDIILYVKNLYGEERVASICTFGTLKKRSAIRDTARVLNIEGLIIDEIIAKIKDFESIKEAISDSELIQNIMKQNVDAKELLLNAAKIEGLNRNISTHASGIIVSKDDITNHTAVQTGLLDMNQTQYEAKDLESVGLLKIDFLGLSNLTVINKITSMIEESEGKKIDIYKVPLDDKKTYDLLKKVDVTGIFQLESQGMRSLIGEMQMREFEDIATVLALFRPGPMQNIPTYIKRRFGKEEINYPHKDLIPILKSTNGIIIYQEQIVRIAAVFAGYSLGEADVLRRAVSKKESSTLQKERKNFVSKSLKKGHNEKTANEIYDYIVKFANYGFNRAHSVAYAMVSYWMAYLKANYPKYFISVLTSSVIGSETKMRNYIYEAYKLGVKILPPSVNKSSLEFLPEDSNLRYPLLGIKNVGVNNAKALLEERNQGEFTSYVDFISRCNNIINKRVIESLIKAGALDEFKLSKRTMLEKLEEVVNFSLLGGFINSDEFVLEDLKEYDFNTLEAFEISVLGFNLQMNPLNEHVDYIKKHKLIKPSELKSDQIGKEIRIIGILSSFRKITTKNNKEMAFISLMDEFSKLDGVLFTNTYQTYKDDLEKNKVYLLKSKVEERNDNLQLIVNKLHKL